MLVASWYMAYGMLVYDLCCMAIAMFVPLAVVARSHPFDPLSTGERIDVASSNARLQCFCSRWIGP